jgi:cytochrome c peroxidase
VPSLRNLLFTAPYMHDGSMKTLLDVIEFYNAKTHTNGTTSEFITKHNPLGLQLTAKQKGELYAFLVSLSDSSFIEDARFQRP